MKKALLIVGLIIVVVVAAGGVYFWRAYQKFMMVETIVVDPRLTIYIGCGNSIVLTSEDGSSALIVDTKMKGAATSLKSFVKAKNITIVNTHSHFDHVGGNALYPQATIIAGAYSKNQWDEDGNKFSRYPDIRLAPGEEKIIKIDTETVHIYNTGRAHTGNDVVVYLENRKLLVTGDLVFHQWHPALVAQSGTNVASWMRVLDALSGKYQVMTLVPGHGMVTNQSALTAMKDYFGAVSDSVGNKNKQAAVKEKYKDYFAFPGVFGFNNTLKYIQQERK